MRFPNQILLSRRQTVNSPCSISSNTSTESLAHLLGMRLSLPTRRRLSIYIIGSIALVWVIQSLGLFGAAEVDSLLLLLLVAVVYMSFRQPEQSARVREHNDRLQVVSTPSTAKQTQQQESELFRRVFDQAACMALVAPGGRWLTVNRSLCITLGYSAEELLEKSFLDLAHPDDVGSTLVQIEKLLEGRTASHQAEQRLIHKLGHYIWMLLNVSAVRDGEGNPSHLVFQFWDITDRKMEEERLVHDVFHDALTGLPNRALFMDRLRLATERSRRRKDQVFAVLFVDLDGFKTINDSLGHIMGDQLLIQVSRRLKACLRTTDTIARLGGDEFTILLEDLTEERESLRVVERLQKELALPFKLCSRELQVTASIGITSNHGYERAEEILRDADAAMYRAKSSGKACYQYFDRERHSTPVDVANLGDDLEKAVERDELVLHYQPIVSVETGKLCAFEALVRWRHPKRGLMLPGDFIPLAEEQGSIQQIGTWAMREACRQLKVWHDRFPMHRSLAVSVNLSSKQFMQANLIDQVIEILQDTGLEPRSLKLEITESVVMENIGTATVVLQQLRALGIDLGIDDFGTGYSSLSYLHRLPINSLKVDKSFVKGMVEKREHGEIVKTIITLARSLGIRVIAEGVETLEQLRELRRLQCDAGQGFLFSKPAEAESVEKLIVLRNQWQTTVTSVDLHGQFEETSQRTTNGMVTSAHRRPLLRAV